MINIIRDLPILCNVKWEEHGRNELGINSSEAVGRRKEGMDIVSISLLSGIPHISLDNPCILHTSLALSYYSNSIIISLFIQQLRRT